MPSRRRSSTRRRRGGADAGDARYGFHRVDRRTRRTGERDARGL